MGKMPSSNKNVDDQLDYTIEKNPEFNMHHPKFAETFKKTMSPDSVDAMSPDRPVKVESIED